MDPELLEELERIAEELNRLVGASATPPKTPKDLPGPVPEGLEWYITDGVPVLQRPQAYSVLGGTMKDGLLVKDGTRSVLDIVNRVAGDTAVTMRNAGIGQFAVFPGEERTGSLAPVSFGSDFLFLVAQDLLEFDPERTDQFVIGQLPDVEDQIRRLAVRDQSRIMQAFPGTPTRRDRFHATVDSMEAAGLLPPERANAIRQAGTAPFRALSPEAQMAAAQDIDAINAALPAIDDAALRNVNARGRTESADPQQNRYAQEVTAIATGDSFLAGRSPLPRLSTSTQAQAAQDRRYGEMRTMVEAKDAKNLVKNALLGQGISASAAGEMDPERGAAHAKAVAQLEGQTAKFLAKMEADGIYTTDEMTDTIINFLRDVTSEEKFEAHVSSNLAIREQLTAAEENEAAQQDPKEDVDRFLLKYHQLLPEGVTKDDYIKLLVERSTMTGEEFKSHLDANIDTIKANKQFQTEQEEWAKLGTSTGAESGAKQALFSAGLTPDDITSGRMEWIKQMVKDFGVDEVTRFLKVPETKEMLANEKAAEEVSTREGAEGALDNLLYQAGLSKDDLTDTRYATLTRNVTAFGEDWVFEQLTSPAFRAALENETLATYTDSEIRAISPGFAPSVSVVADGFERVVGDPEGFRRTIGDPFRQAAADAATRAFDPEAFLADPLATYDDKDFGVDELPRFLKDPATKEMLANERAIEAWRSAQAGSSSLPFDPEAFLADPLAAYDERFGEFPPTPTRGAAGEAVSGEGVTPFPSFDSRSSGNAFTITQDGKVVSASRLPLEYPGDDALNALLDELAGDEIEYRNFLIEQFRTTEDQPVSPAMADFNTFAQEEARTRTRDAFELGKGLTGVNDPKYKAGIAELDAQVKAGTITTRESRDRSIELRDQFGGGPASSFAAKEPARQYAIPHRQDFSDYFRGRQSEFRKQYERSPYAKQRVESEAFDQESQRRRKLRNPVTVVR